MQKHILKCISVSLESKEKTKWKAQFQTSNQANGKETY